MEEAKLEQLKNTISTFEQLFATIREMIEELEDKQSCDDLKQEVLDTISSLKDNADSASSALDEAETSIANAKDEAETICRELQSLIRTLESN